MRRLHAVVLALVVSLLAIALAACAPSYAITIESQDEFCVEECPSSAKAGETVVVRTCVVCDGDVNVSVDGNASFGSFTEEAVYEFTMPDHDVTVRVWITSNGLA